MTVALITGASAGIGQELARVFANHGHDLVLVARRKTRLNELARELRGEHGVQCTTMAADLSAQGACEALYQQILDADIDIEILVNNAGVLCPGAFRRNSLEDIDGMITLNIAVPTRLCRLFLEPMLARSSGRILNVASIAAFQPAPSLAVYAATKAYLLSFTDALVIELQGKGVTATTLCPGFTDTDMLRDSEGNTSIPDMLVATPQEVARAGYAACMAGDPIEVPGMVNTLFTTGTRLLPRWLVRRASAMVTRRGSKSRVD